MIGSLALSLSACSAADDGSDFGLEGELGFRGGGGDGGVIQPPVGEPWIRNGLEDPDVSGINPAHALNTEAGMSTAVGLLEDPDAWSTAQYLVECALPADRSITKVVEGETLVLNGLIGLAPEWEDDACDEDCQEWVSACLLARANESGQTVHILMQAEHEAIGYGVPQGAVLEAGFYGNLFADADQQYLCKGSLAGLVAARREGRTCSLGAGSCDFTTYLSCSYNSRCNLAGPSQNVPSNCKKGLFSNSAPYHTIATYMLPQ